jgi:predicted choloylglycine hydrolase
MKDLGIVRGSALQAKPLVINNNNVYIHTDIKELSDNLYEYHEYQMPLDEFLMRLVAQLESVDLKVMVAQEVSE